MTILLPALAVAFAAICVWLTVRIINRRERWAKWTLAVTVSLPVLYVASFGPACWLRVKLDEPKWLQSSILRVYGPYFRAAQASPVAIQDACVRYRLWWESLASERYDQQEQ